MNTVMKSDEKLKEMFGQKNPFNVPDGYFDDFANKMQEYTQGHQSAPTIHVEEPAKRPTMFTRIKPYLYLAAMFGGLFFGIKVFEYSKSLSKPAVTESAATQAQATGGEDDYINEVCEYAGIDKNQIYAYATGQDAY